MKTSIHPDYVRSTRALHLWQRVHHPCHPRRAARRGVLQLPPLLHRPPKARRHRRTRRALPAPRCQGAAAPSPDGRRRQERRDEPNRRLGDGRCEPSRRRRQSRRCWQWRGAGQAHRRRRQRRRGRCRDTGRACWAGGCRAWAGRGRGAWAGRGRGAARWPDTGWRCGAGRGDASSADDAAAQAEDASPAGAAAQAGVSDGSDAAARDDGSSSQTQPSE